jgi:hypothetical protein
MKMLRHTRDIRGYKLSSVDEEFGKVKEFYFDDALWVVRYLVADTGRWLPGRLVLISPKSLGMVDEDNKKIIVNLTRKNIENSPHISQDKPVSRQVEASLVRFYGWPAYWEQRIEADKHGDPNLRSTKEIIGYSINALDGEIGRITNFIIDDLDWAVRYIVVDTNKWLPGRKVLIALDWVKQVNESDKTLTVDVTRKMIEEAPPYRPEEPIDRDFETALFDHYKKRYYWA